MTESSSRAIVVPSAACPAPLSHCCGLQPVWNGAQNAWTTKAMGVLSCPVTFHYLLKFLGFVCGILPHAERHVMQLASSASMTFYWIQTPWMNKTISLPVKKLQGWGGEGIAVSLISIACFPWMHPAHGGCHTQYTQCSVPDPVPVLSLCVEEAPDSWQHLCVCFSPLWRSVILIFQIGKIH